ncbi:MAG TPA: AraC family transcriptional regulator [Bacteroidia bacterium]|jgi:AraC-like DNA-binding protein
MPSAKLPVFSVKHFKKTAAPSPDFYIKTFQEHKAEHPFIMKPHRHDFYMVMLFTKGKGKHTIDLMTYDVSPGSVFFMSPGEMHSWELSNDCDGFVIMFNTSFFVMTARNRNINEFPFFSLDQKMHYHLLKKVELSEFSALLKAIYGESKTSASLQTAILRAYLEILLLKLTTVLYPGKKAIGKASAGLISRLEALVELNYKNRLPVSFYAEALAISAVQLNILANNYLNLSVAELISGRLLLEAKRLLVYTNLTINEISNELNFSDNSYFTKFFKKAIGQTPEQFRKLFTIDT